MLAWLPYVFFFAVLMGSPVPGFLVFMLIGVVHSWQSWRQPNSASAFHWTKQDSWLALCFISIPLFKLLTLIWSPAPQLAIVNAVWHLYFFFWPLVLVGLHACKDEILSTEKAIAAGMICFGLYAIGLELTGDSVYSPGIHANVGILAQLVMAAGIWNFAILTRPQMDRNWRVIHLGAMIAAFLILIFTTRRLELLGLIALTGLMGIYRLRNSLNISRFLLLMIILIGTAAVLIYARFDKFHQGLSELQLFFFDRANHPDIIYTSWGARLEMWRTAWMAFLENPWLGISASARPYAMGQWGGPTDIASFGHRHFHSHLMQTLVEGGIVGFCVMAASLYGSTCLLITKPWRQQRELALLSLCLLGAYIAEGLASAALQYDKSNAYLVVTSAWLWTHIRAAQHPTAVGQSKPALH